MSVARHESLGFVHLGVYRRVGWKFGTWHDVGYWQRRVDERTVGAPEPLHGLDELAPNEVAAALRVRLARGSS